MKVNCHLFIEVEGDSKYNGEWIFRMIFTMDIDK